MSVGPTERESLFPDSKLSPREAIHFPERAVVSESWTEPQKDNESSVRIVAGSSLADGTSDSLEEYWALSWHGSNQMISVFPRAQGSHRKAVQT